MKNQHEENTARQHYAGTDSRNYLHIVRDDKSTTQPQTEKEEKKDRTVIKVGESLIGFRRRRRPEHPRDFIL